MQKSKAKKRKSTSKKACVACAVNKRACSGERPCGRCERLGIACIDKLDRRSKAYREKVAQKQSDIVSVVQPGSKSKRKVPSVGAKVAASLLQGVDSAEGSVSGAAKGSKTKSRSTVQGTEGLQTSLGLDAVASSYSADQLQGAQALVSLVTSAVAQPPSVHQPARLIQPQYAVAGSLQSYHPVYIGGNLSGPQVLGQGVVPVGHLLGVAAPTGSTEASSSSSSSMEGSPYMQIDDDVSSLSSLSLDSANASRSSEHVLRPAAEASTAAGTAFGFDGDSLSVPSAAMDSDDGNDYHHGAGTATPGTTTPTTTTEASSSGSIPASSAAQQAADLSAPPSPPSLRLTRPMPQATVIKTIDSRGCGHVQYSPNGCRPDFANWFVWRGTEWVWTNNRMCDALTRWYFDRGVQGVTEGGAAGSPGERPLGGGGSWSSPARVRALALEDLRAAEAISHSELPQCRAVYDPRTMQFRAGVINGAGRSLIDMDDGVRQMEEEGIISTPGELPGNVGIGSMVIMRALLMRETSLVVPGNTMRYCFSSQRDREHCQEAQAAFRALQRRRASMGERPTEPLDLLRIERAVELIRRFISERVLLHTVEQRLSISIEWAGLVPRALKYTFYPIGEVPTEDQVRAVPQPPPSVAIADLRGVVADCLGADWLSDEAGMEQGRDVDRLATLCLGRKWRETASRIQDPPPWYKTGLQEDRDGGIGFAAGVSGGGGAISAHPQATEQASAQTSMGQVRPRGKQNSDQVGMRSPTSGMTAEEGPPGLTRESMAGRKRGRDEFDVGSEHSAEATRSTPGASHAAMGPGDSWEQGFDESSSVPAAVSTYSPVALRVRPDAIQPRPGSAPKRPRVSKEAAEVLRSGSLHGDLGVAGVGRLSAGGSSSSHSLPLSVPMADGAVGRADFVDFAASANALSASAGMKGTGDGGSAAFGPLQPEEIGEMEALAGDGEESRVTQMVRDRGVVRAVDLWPFASEFEKVEKPDRKALRAFERWVLRKTEAVK